MKLYFAASIRGGRDHADKYNALINELTKNHTILSEHVADTNLDETGSDGDEETIHDQDLAWIKEADAVIADVTQPSLGVGYEVATAKHHDKNILCIYHEPSTNELSAMIQGSPITTKPYDDVETARSHIERFLNHD